MRIPAAILRAFALGRYHTAIAHVMEVATNTRLRCCRIFGHLLSEFCRRQGLTEQIARVLLMASIGDDLRPLGRIAEYKGPL
jgi:hypothetical protein